ncbi:hypothetical protein QEN19_003163 [Hanseniaspora menglaensis]
MAFNLENEKFDTLGVLKVSLHNRLHVYPIIKNKILTCGRDSKCTISISHTNYISKVHFRVWCTQFDDSFDPVCYVQDMSLNGTYIFDNKKNLYQKLKKNKISILNNKNSIMFPHEVNASIKEVKIKYIGLSIKDCSRLSSYQNIKIEKLPESIGKWKFNETVLGIGAFGVVFGCSEDNGQLSCCKVIKQVLVPIRKQNSKRISHCSIFNRHYRKINNKNPLHFQKIYKETEILKSLDHPNIVQHFESRLILNSEEHKFQENYYYKYSNYLIYQELGSGGDLFSFLLDSKTNKLRFIPEKEAIVIVYQIVLALKYLHEKNIAHRDLKLDNIILFTPEPFTRIMLTDFGISKKSEPLNFDESHTNFRFKTCVGTPEYTAPEVGDFNRDTVRDLIQEKLFETEHHKRDNQKGYSQKCDIWSLGILLYYLWTGNPFFGTQKVQDTFTDLEQQNLNSLQSWINGKVDRVVEINPVSKIGRSFLKKLLIIKEKSRLDSHGCINDTYINEHKEVLENFYKKKVLPTVVKALPLNHADSQNQMGSKRAVITNENGSEVTYDNN